MYSITLNWIGINLNWYICDPSRSELVLQSYFPCSYGADRKVHYKLSDVQTLFIQNVLPRVSPNDINLAICVLNDKLPLLGSEDNFVKQVEAYLYSLGIRYVRFMQSPFFDATRALVKMRSNGICQFKEGYTILMLLSFGTLSNIVPWYVYIIVKTEKGWQAKQVQCPPTALCQLQNASKFLAACKININSVDHVVIFEDGGDYQKVFPFLDKKKTTAIAYFPHPTAIDAAIYLSRIYTDFRKDLSCYVPVSCHWDFKIYKNGKLLPLCFNFALPGIEVIEFDETGHKENLQLKLEDDTNVKEIVVPITKKERIRLVLAVGENGVLGLRVQFQGKSRFTTKMVYHPRVFDSFYPLLLVATDIIRPKCWDDRGIFIDLSDVNGLTAIPQKVTFLHDVPVVGSAASEIEGALNHNVLDLFNVEIVKKKIQAGSTDLFLDENSQINVVVQTSKGPSRTTPSVILGVIIKSIVKLAEQNSGQSVEGIKLSACSLTQSNIEDLKKLLNLKIIQNTW